jgi:hypothetical protein
MRLYPTLYPHRSRNTNIQLIENIIYADCQASYKKAAVNLTDNLHPSLFAELDWMEMSIPSEHSENATKLVDELFLSNLERIIASRLLDAFSFLFAMQLTV